MVMNDHTLAVHHFYIYHNEFNFASGGGANGPTGIRTRTSWWTARCASITPSAQEGQTGCANCATMFHRPTIYKTEERR